MAENGHIFVSYSRADRAFVADLADYLAGQNIDTWRDSAIPTGERWDEVLRERIETCAALIVIMSAEAGRSEWVRREIGYAQAIGKKILPLRLSGETIFSLDGIQVEDVSGGRMPSVAFVQRVRRDISRRRVLRYASGVVPEAADSFQRREVADLVDSVLSDDGSTITPGGSARILSGLGGVGKTQLAATVARRARSNAEVDVLLWITATGRTDILGAYSQAAGHLVGADPTDPERAAAAFRAYLAHEDVSWLIVFDDLANPSDVDGLWPPRTSTGRVIVTTRRRDSSLRSHGSIVPVDLFTPDDAHRYLIEKFAHQPHRVVEADELAADLGYLPLALAQAAAYIGDRDLTCATYRARFADRQRTLTDLVPDSLPDDYTRPLTVAMSLAVDAADALPPVGLARRLLVILSLLDPNGIPTSLVGRTSITAYLTDSQASPAETATTADIDRAHDALAALVRLNLATTTAAAIRVHALVQRCVRELSAAALVDLAAVAATHALLDSWPQIERDPQLAQALRANTAALRHNAQDQLWQSAGRDLLFRAGRSLHDAGMVAAAIDYWKDLCERTDDVLGRDHADSLATRSNLAAAYRSAGRLDEAVELWEAIIADNERVFGPDHASTLTMRHNLAVALLPVQLDRAIALLETVLVRIERVLGPGHRDALSSRSDLAAAYARAGRLDQAITMHEATVGHRARLLGPEDPDTLASRHQLAGVYRSAGRLSQAIALYEDNLADRERILGPDHPLTFASRGNLAGAYREDGRVEQAVVLYEDTLSGTERVLGPDHPATLTLRSNLAGAYRAAGRLDQAISTYQSALTNAQRLLGRDHPTTKTIQENLALALRTPARVDVPTED